MNLSDMGMGAAIGHMLEIHFINSGQRNKSSNEYYIFIWNDNWRDLAKQRLMFHLLKVLHNSLKINIVCTCIEATNSGKTKIEPLSAKNLTLKIVK